jgi:hypothetical protein
MKQKIYFLFIFLFIFIMSAVKDSSFAATVGNALDLDLPAKSAVLKEQAVRGALDDYEQTVKIKTALDLEFVFDKDLKTTWELTGAEMKGSWHMVKLATTLFNRVEPYIKLGTSNLMVEWTQSTADSTDSIEVEADYGFAWGAGVKAVLWDFEDLGIRLTGDAQYRVTEPDVSKISRNSGSTDVIDQGADFKVEEWQLSLVLSKKYELPLKWQSVYLVPYAGMTISDSVVDVKFDDSSMPGTDYSLFDAGNKNSYGFVIGCDIMPSLKSSFIYSIEARLFNELALTLGGAMKF